MRSSVLTTFVVLALSFTNAAVVRRNDAASSEVSDPTSVETDLAQTAYDNLSAYLEEVESSSTVEQRTTQCTLGNISIRREWGTLPQTQRKAYIDAVPCLQSKPSKSDPALVPGARSIYDDFVATHINQTLSIHGAANFLSWHRYYTWSFEQALRNECGYRGTQPYWNWAKYSDDPGSFPIFDGSAYSLSGNGAYVAGRSNISVGGGAISIPPGNSGGCLTNGPFTDMVVNLGPLAGRNHRLDQSQPAIQRPWLQSPLRDFDNGFLGVHSAGHLIIAGDPGGVFFASPADPVFWWIWQNLDLRTRIETIAGTITINSRPPSRDGTLDDTINLGVIAPTVDGPFCYIYL
ncbi:tyrosinase central domain-containing protein [Tirmania nivea]|nr:tyrosinase central domain-containing protein [Tirmania nivea]